MQKITAFMMIVAAGFAAMPTQAKDPKVPANRAVHCPRHQLSPPPSILLPAKDRIQGLGSSFG